MQPALDVWPTSDPIEVAKFKRNHDNFSSFTYLRSCNKSNVTLYSNVKV